VIASATARPTTPISAATAIATRRARRRASKTCSPQLSIPSSPNPVAGGTVVEFKQRATDQKGLVLLPFQKRIPRIGELTPRPRRAQLTQVRTNREDGRCDDQFDAPFRARARRRARSAP